MAIDASIPLGYKPAQSLDLMGAATTGMKLAQMGQAIEQSKQEISASKTAQAATEAGIPGIQAESYQKQHAAEFTKWKTDNAAKYMNEDGSLNLPGFIAHANKAGFATEAQAVAASDLANKSAAITNSVNEQNKNVAISNFTSSALNHVATLLDNPKLTNDQKAAQLRTHVDFLNKQVPGSGDQVLAALGKPQSDGSYTVDPAAIQATAQATMTKQEQTSNLINKQNADTSAFSASTSAESVKQAGVAQATGPEARDPNSAQSRQAVQAAINAGISGITVGVTSAADLANLPGIKGQVEATTVPASAKAAAATSAVSETQAANVYSNAANLVDKLVKSGKMAKGMNVSQFIAANANKLSNDPDFRALQAALTQVTAANPAIDIMQVDAAGLSAQLKSQQELAKQRATTAASIAKSTTFNQVPGAAPPNIVTHQHAQEYAKRKGKPVNQVIKELADKGIMVQK